MSRNCDDKYVYVYEKLNVSGKKNKSTMYMRTYVLITVYYYGRACVLGIYNTFKTNSTYMCVCN